MLIICRDPHIGDSICAMAAVQILSRTKRRVYLSTANIYTELLMRPPHVQSWNELAGPIENPVIMLSMAHILTTRGRYAHPIRAYLDQAGYWKQKIDITPKILRVPEVSYDTEQLHWPTVPTYDFLFACFSKEQNRLWPNEKWQHVFDVLRTIPGCRIGLIGAANDPRPFEGVDYLYGLYLSTVIALMRRVRGAVITIDSGPGRVAHLAGITNHIMMHPAIYPELWVTHPGARCLVIDDLEPIQVLEAIEATENANNATNG